MDFTVGTRASTALPGAHNLPDTAANAPRADLARSLLRDPRSDVYHLYPSIHLAMRLLQPMRDAALGRPAFGIFLQRPV
jgi:hypothetical protein